MRVRRKEVELTPAPVAVELTQETKESLSSLLSEIHVAIELFDDVLTRANEIALAVNVDLKKHIQVAPDPAPDVSAPPSNDEGRRRDSPYRRRPQSEQRAWLLGIIADGRWYHPHVIAKEISSEEREYRYLRAAIGRTFALLLDEGVCERGASTERGSMFRYRLIQRLK
jgi:hypothetical protein